MERTRKKKGGVLSRRTWLGEIRSDGVGCWGIALHGIGGCFVGQYWLI